MPDTNVFPRWHPLLLREGLLWNQCDFIVIFYCSTDNVNWNLCLMPMDAGVDWRLLSLYWVLLCKGKEFSVGRQTDGLARPWLIVRVNNSRFGLG